VVQKAPLYAEGWNKRATVLFMMGAHSAVFAPVKYSVLPQYLAPRELMGGNGLVQGSTFLAIIFGTIIGNELILAIAADRIYAP